MEILIKKDYEDMSLTVAKMVQKEIINNPNLVLGLATGSTPKGVYKELIRMHKEENLDFSKITSFNLDEYIGLDSEDPTSYNYFMQNKLFNHINIKNENIFIPPSNPIDEEKACKEYDKMIEEKGGIDFQILGIGENGHIAFIEPSSELNIKTNVARLTEDTIEVNSRFFDSISEVPKTAISMGIGSIMKAKKIVLMANGKNKADIIKKILDTKTISTEIPASILLLHPNITFVLTEDTVE